MENLNGHLPNLPESVGGELSLQDYTINVSLETLDSCADFERGHSTEQVYELLFGTEHADRYREEKLAKLKTGGVMHLWGGLDSGKRDRLLMLIIANKGNTLREKGELDSVR